MNSCLEINFGQYFPFASAKQVKLFWIFEVVQKTDFPTEHRYQPNLCIHKTIYEELSYYLIRSYNPNNLRADKAWRSTKHISYTHDYACVLRRNIKNVDGVTGSVQTGYTDTNSEKSNSKSWRRGVASDQNK